MRRIKFDGNVTSETALDSELEGIPSLKMLDARPGFIIKILKRSLIDKFIKNTSFRLFSTRAFDQSAWTHDQKSTLMTAKS